MGTVESKASSSSSTNNNNTSSSSSSSFLWTEEELNNDNNNIIDDPYYYWSSSSSSSTTKSSSSSTTKSSSSSSSSSSLWSMKQSLLSTTTTTPSTMKTSSATSTTLTTSSSWIFPNRIASCEAVPPAPPPLPPIGVDGGGVVVGGGGGGGAPPPPPPSPEAEVNKENGKTTSTSSQQQQQQQQLEDDITRAAQSATSPPIFPNPGMYENATLDCRRLITLDTYDGFRCDINKQLSPFMAVIHSFWLGTSMLPDGRNKSYTFLTQVADTDGFYMGRIDPEKFSVDGRIQRMLLNGLVLFKLQFNTAGGGAGGDGGDGAEGGAAAAMGGGGGAAPGSNDQLLTEIDINGDTWTSNFKYGSMAGGNVFGCNYFQSINTNWAMGGEGMYLSANNALLSNYLVKYTKIGGGTGTKNSGDDKDDTSTTSTNPSDDSNTTTTKPGQTIDDTSGSYSICASYNNAQGLLSLNYRRTITPKRVNLGAELQCSPISLDSQVVFGAEFQLTRSKVSLVVDGTGRIQSTLESKLGIEPGSPSLNFAAEVDHFKDVMKFGYGLNIGG